MPGLGGHREELNGFPAIFNIEQDPREEVNVLATSGWVIAQYLRLIGEYQKTTREVPKSQSGQPYGIRQVKTHVGLEEAPPMTAICAFETFEVMSRIDVNRTLWIAAADVVVGGSASTPAARLGAERPPSSRDRLARSS